MVSKLEEENNLENLILTGMILDTEFLKRLSSVPLLKLLETKHARILSVWILEYFSVHHVAPSSTITEIIENKKQKLEPASAILISKLIEYIAERYGDEQEVFDFDYAILATESYIQSRALLLCKEEQERLIGDGKVAEAYKLQIEFKLPILTVDSSKKDLFKVLPSMALTFSQLEEMELPSKEYLLLGEWPIERASVSLLTGEAGCGKTWFALEISRIIASADIGLAGTCNANTPVKTLIIDGELPLNEIRSRSSILELEDIRNLTLISKTYLEKHDVVPVLNLNEANVRDRITEYIIENGFELVILDNLFSLFSNLDLNSAEEWGPINDWFLRLRAKDVATILSHHLNKNQDQLGSISKTFNINTHLSIKRDFPSDKDEDCCCFSVSIKKQRGTGIRLPGKKFIFRNKIWTTEPFSGRPSLKSKIEEQEFQSHPVVRKEPGPRPSLKTDLRKPIFKTYSKKED